MFMSRVLATICSNFAFCGIRLVEFCGFCKISRIDCTCLQDCRVISFGKCQPPERLIVRSCSRTLPRVLGPIGRACEDVEPKASDPTVRREDVSFGSAISFCCRCFGSLLETGRHLMSDKRLTFPCALDKLEVWILNLSHHRKILFAKNLMSSSRCVRFDLLVVRRLLESGYRLLPKVNLLRFSFGEET